MRLEGVQGVLTLFCSGVCHDDRVVVFKEQLEVEEEDGEGQEEEIEEKKERANQGERAMSMTVDDYEWTQNLSHEVCGVIINCGTKMRAQAQCMYATRPSRSTSSLVSCLVSCMLYALFQLLFVMMLLVLIAVYRSHCFHRSHFTLFCCIEGIVFKERGKKGKGKGQGKDEKPAPNWSFQGNCRSCGKW